MECSVDVDERGVVHVVIGGEVITAVVADATAIRKSSITRNDTTDEPGELSVEEGNVTLLGGVGSVVVEEGEELE